MHEVIVGKTPEFQAWPKIPRWKGERFVVTEKIDGTNGCIVVTVDGDIFAQSRSKFLDETSAGDNYGFCKWVNGHKNDLLSLGVGYHYGEWWGYGIQRGYGAPDKRFSLFNIWHDSIPECVSKVPFMGMNVEEALNKLQAEGSQAFPGYMRPEGVVLRAKQPEPYYKLIIDK